MRMNHVVRAPPVETNAVQNASRFTPGRLGPEALPVELAQYERAVDVAVKALIVLAAQSALAAMALREVSDALGCRLRDGVLADAAGRHHAYVDGFDLGEFETFDAALDELRHGLASIREPVRVIAE